MSRPRVPVARLLYAALLALWCTASWVLSSQHDPEEYVGVRLHLPDKVEHGIEYAAGGWFAAGAMWREQRRPAWMSAVIFCTAWGALDEYHQSFVAGRDSSGLDLAADAAGASVGALACVAWAGRRQTPGRRVDVKDEPADQRRRP